MAVFRVLATADNYWDEDANRDPHLDCELLLKNALEICFAAPSLFVEIGS